MARLIISLLLLLASLTVAAGVVDTEKFSSEILRLRYIELTDELRCPKCQNQNLADSNSAIAIDLRLEVRRLLEEGNSDREIVDHLVARYGDFVRYRPPLKPATWLLWGAPGLLMVVVLTALWSIRRRRKPKQSQVVILSREEQMQLDNILQGQSAGQVDSQREQDPSG